MELNDLSNDQSNYEENVLSNSGGSIYQTNSNPPVTSERSSLLMNNKKPQKQPGFCKSLFFCQFNKFFRKNEFKEEEMNPLPDPVCSENILEKFDKLYKMYEEKDKKKEQKKITKIEGNLAKSKTTNPLNLDDSTTNPLGRLNHSFSQTLEKNSESPSKNFEINTNFVFKQSLTHSMIEMNPVNNQKLIKEKRLKMDILMKAIFKIIKGKMIAATILNVISTMLKIAIPISMKKFLQDYKAQKPILNLVPYILLASFLSFLDGILTEHATKNVCGCKAASGQILRSVFYRKITRANYSFLKVTDASFINKMILYEFEHINDMIGEIPKLIASPITLCIAMFYIFVELQALVLIVFGVFAGFVLLLIFVKRRSVRRLRAYFTQESKKSEKLNECIPNMKQIKLNSLEKYYLRKLQNIRKRESKDLMKFYLYDAFSDSIFGSTPLFCSILVIGAMAILNGKLTASGAFSVIIVLELLGDPLDALSNSIDRLESYSSAKKAFQYFLEDVPEKTHMLQPADENFPDGQIILNKCNFDFVKENEMTKLLDKMMGEEWAKLKADKEKEIKIKKVKTFGPQRLSRMKTNSLIFSGSFRGSTNEFDKDKKAKENYKKTEKFVTLLTNISVVIKPGQKVCLVGMPGSGFSEFLLSLMNESKLSNNGIMKVKGSISYLNVRMENFFKGSVKRNIILNSEYDKNRFKHVIRMMNINLKSLKGQEYFRILEGAKNLTTDMQRKILLARWVYEKKDIYLIDDLFDDMNIMEWNMIYERVFCGELRNKTVIFMSYTNLQIKIADHIIVFDSGRIVEQGSYVDLLKNPNGELRKIVSKNNSGEEKSANLFSKIVEGTRRPKSGFNKRSSILAHKKKSMFSFAPKKVESEEEEEKVEEPPKRLSNGLFASLKKKKNVEEPPKRLSNGLFASLKKKKNIEEPQTKAKIYISEEPIFEEEENEDLKDSIIISERDNSINSNNKQGLFAALKKPKKALDLKQESKSEIDKKELKINVKESIESYVSLEEDKDRVIELPSQLNLLLPSKPRHNMKKRKSKLNSSLMFSPPALEEDKDTPEENPVLDGLVKNFKFMEDLQEGESLGSFGKEIEKESLNYNQAQTFLKKYMLLRGKCPLILIIVLFLISALFLVSYDIWIGFWSIKMFGEKEDSPFFYFTVYLSLSVIGTIYLVFRDVIYARILYGSSNLVNKIVIDIMLRLKMSWFNGQSVERIIYRLTKDQSQLDIFIPKLVLRLIESIMMVFVGFVILNYIYYGLLILFSLIYVCIIRSIFKRYLRVVMSMTHMVTQRKSEVVSLGGQTLNMCVYLRGTKNLGYLKRKFFISNDHFQKCTTHVANFSQRWIGVRLTYIATSLVFGVFCFPIIASVKRDFFFQEVWKIAFSMTWGFKTIKYIKLFLRNMSLVFMNIISISRLYEYVEAKPHIEVKYGSKQEDDDESRMVKRNGFSEGKVVPKNQVPDLKRMSISPTHSQISRNSKSLPSETPDAMIPLLKNFKLNNIVLKNVSLSERFRGDVLHNVSIKIEAGETVGLYGRSLSGIPDLLEVACGLYDRKRGKGYENSDIMIHGQSIDNFKLSSWRKCFEYLKEEPLIMSGKVRNNIDPFGKWNDDDLIKALDLFKFNELINIQIKNEGDSIDFEKQENLNSSIKMDSVKLGLILEEDEVSERDISVKNVADSWNFNTPVIQKSAGKFTTNQSLEDGKKLIKNNEKILNCASDKKNPIEKLNGNKLDKWLLPNDDEEEKDGDSTTQVDKKRKNAKIKSNPMKLKIDMKPKVPHSVNNPESDRNKTPAFGQEFDFRESNISNDEKNDISLGRLSKTMKKERRDSSKDVEDIKIRMNSDISGGSNMINNERPMLMNNNPFSLSPKKSSSMDKRRHSAFTNPVSVTFSHRKAEDEPENMNPDILANSNSNERENPQSPMLTQSHSFSRADSQKTNTEKKVVNREELANHVVTGKNRENIEDFLEYEVLPKAGNLTIGLKKIIMLTKVFLEEPNFIILEENALDFDELDNSYFFNILKNMKSTVLMSMCTMNFLMGFDRIIILEKGKVVEKGKPAKLLMDQETILYSEVEEVDPGIIKKLKRDIEKKKNGNNTTSNKNPLLSLLMKNNNSVAKKATKGKA